MGPVSAIASVFTGTNAALIATVARLYIDLERDIVLDPTFGRGGWWENQPVHFIHHDINLDRVDFRQLPEADQSIDVVTFDPPYTSPGGRKTSTIPDFNDRYGLVDVPRTPAETMDLIAAGMKECARVLKPGGRLLSKVQDYVSSGKMVPGLHHVLDTGRQLGLEYVDLFVHVRHPGPQPSTNPDGTPRVQQHSRRAHSFLVVHRVPVTPRRQHDRHGTGPGDVS